MPAVLKEWEFEIDEGLVLGQGNPLRLVDFAPGESTFRRTSRDNPVGSDRLHGSGLTTPPTWSFTCMALGAGKALPAAGALEAFWLAERATGSDVAIRYRMDGRERITYGRPAGFRAVPRKGMPNRLIDIEATFELTSNVSYDAAEQYTTITLFVAPTGFFTMPFTFPVFFNPSRVESSRTIPTGGNVPTPFTARIYGPISDFYLEGTDWKIDSNASIAEDQWAELDTRANTLTRSDGANLGGTLNRFSRLSGIRINPGGDYIRLGGNDPTGTSRVEIRWRNTYRGI